ncbi:unnamed protein product [Schistocephalus solidus]|uniref:LisH domain-containing protein n=1 Tax=Schistocephalus solidus TaxID=70667 RepID=A0A183TJE8_SCHSO|nr:unnamed protein product [Schistocephalus solidus]
MLTYVTKSFNISDTDRENGLLGKQLDMDAYASLIEMGFLEFEIQEALKFQSSLPQTVILPTGEPVFAVGSVPNEIPLQDELPPTSGATSSTGEPHQQDSDCLKSRYKLLQPSFEIQQDEAKKLAAEMRLERLRRAEDRDRILRQLEEDKLQKLNQPSNNAELPMEVESSSKEPLPSATATQLSDGASAELVKIRLTFSNDWHLPASEAAPAPLVIPLQPDSKYSHLLEQIHSQLSLLQPRRVLADGVTTHQNNPFTLPCVSLVVTTDWPRRRLPLDSDQFVKTVREMNLKGNVSVVVDHVLAACAFRMPDEAEPTAQVEAAENESEEEMDNESEPAPPTPPPLPEEEPVNPPLNPQPVEVVPEPTPPNHFPPGLTRTPGRAGNAAIFRASMEQLRRGPPTTGEIKKHTLYYQCLPLREICLKSLVSLLVRSVKAGGESGVSFDSITEAVRQSSSSVSCSTSSVVGATHALRSMSFPWPEAVGAELVRRLCAEGCFNSRTALLVKNCICRLDLGFYQLATSDLIMCIGRHWRDLVELHLNELKKLLVLQLDGLQAVNDQTIVPLAGLPKLRVLGVAGTAVTDAGWRSVVAVPVTTPRLLQTLDLSGTSAFTDAGLLHVAQAFPHLICLKISHTQRFRAYLHA